MADSFFQEGIKHVIRELEKELPCPFRFIPKGRGPEDVVFYKVMRYLSRLWWRQQKRASE